MGIVYEVHLSVLSSNGKLLGTDHDHHLHWCVHKRSNEKELKKCIVDISSYPTYGTFQLRSSQLEI